MRIRRHRHGPLWPNSSASITRHRIGCCLGNHVFCSSLEHDGDQCLCLGLFPATCRVGEFVDQLLENHGYVPFPYQSSLNAATNSVIGGFCVTYFQTQWVAKSGAAVTFGCQAAVIAFGFIFVVATQILGRSWRAKYPAPVAEH